MLGKVEDELEDQKGVHSAMLVQLALPPINVHTWQSAVCVTVCLVKETAIVEDGISVYAQTLGGEVMVLWWSVMPEHTQ